MVLLVIKVIFLRKWVICLIFFGKGLDKFKVKLCGNFVVFKWFVVLKVGYRYCKIFSGDVFVYLV